MHILLYRFVGSAPHLSQLGVQYVPSLPPKRIYSCNEPLFVIDKRVQYCAALRAATFTCLFATLKAHHFTFSHRAINATQSHHHPPIALGTNAFDSLELSRPRPHDHSCLCQLRLEARRLAHGWPSHHLPPATWSNIGVTCCSPPVQATQASATPKQ